MPVKAEVLQSSLSRSQIEAWSFSVSWSLVSFAVGPFGRVLVLHASQPLMVSCRLPDAQ